MVMRHAISMVIHHAMAALIPIMLLRVLSTTATGCHVDPSGSIWYGGTPHQLHHGSHVNQVGLWWTWHS